MTKSYFPFDAGAGANVVEAQWALMARLFCPTGVAQGQLNQLEVFADNTGMLVKVKSGQAFVEGFFFQSDAQENLSISPAHASLARIDRVIVRLDRTANTMDLAVLTGTAAASPSAPALTQNSTTWEIGLALIAVGAAVTSITAGNVTDERGYTVNWNSPNIPVTVRKGSDESVTSSTVPQDDNELFFTGVASGRYLVELLLKLFSSSSIPDFLWLISAPAGATVTIFEGATPVDLTAGTERDYIIRFTVELSTTGGRVGPQWAQNTSNGTATTVRAASLLRYTKYG